ncbi:RNA ligase (ATP) [Candidatus Uabimicrobium amorphum]|uniref:RNA ligase domain-containing protein n=1 Tax=Uabimicrobium amorphum TaxID=2596890 RepID=A0A5S9IJ09_UABAM|nr:RNA ligase (ATP) [Candidatus Uabimicrobium amorphum]BBM82346.1 hypothetical protein UABAM_00689 [Candidatus Uabimicrobium amorphum]
MRKLCSVQQVVDISPIEKADKIEQIQVLGWTLVAKKGEFQKGDLCVYFEIDSLLPDLPMFQFIKRSEKPSALRLRTVKLRGVISQGLAMPTDILNEFDVDTANLHVGQDLTEVIGVKKYEPPQRGQQSRKLLPFPYYVRKTDEIRIQSQPQLIEEFVGKDCYIAIKLDGCSATYSLKDGEFHVCSRNYALGEPLNPNISAENDYYSQIAEKYTLEEKLKSQGNFAIQGEICGPRVQKNRLELSELSFFVFNVWDIDKQEYLAFDDFIEFCKRIDLPTVPILESHFHFDETVTAESLLKMAEGKYANTKNEREGIVVRPRQETQSEILGGRLSCKAISNKFLLKGGD